jgi:hypothetical protein
MPTVLNEIKQGVRRFDEFIMNAILARIHVGMAIAFVTEKGAFYRTDSGLTACSKLTYCLLSRP